MYNVRRILVPAKLIRINDYVPFGGIVVQVRKSRAGGLFPKSYITLTFYTKDEDYVDYTVESHIPIDAERVAMQITRNIKEKK